MLALELPFPPSLNHYYRHVGHATLISRQGREYRNLVVAHLAALGVSPLAGPLELVLELYPPDRRRRDADNAMKGLLDALQHGGAYHDDNQLAHLDVWKLAPRRGGKALVTVRELTHDEIARRNPSSLALHLQPN